MPTIADTNSSHPGREKVRATGAWIALLILVSLTLSLPAAARLKQNWTREEALAGGKELVELLKQPGHIALMRHALAPFDNAPKETNRKAEELGQCETQRNLDEVGRTDARRIGALFKQAGVVFEGVFTSKWCRCKETAELILGKPVENLRLVNSYYTHPDKATIGPAQLAELKAWINRDVSPKARVLLVTHGSLIKDMTGIDTLESEVVVVKADGRGGVIVVGNGIPN